MYRFFIALAGVWLIAGPALAQMQVAQATQTAPLRNLGERIGVAGAVRGEVRLTPYDAAAGAVGAVTRSGAPVRLGDKVQSGPDSGLQVILLDETVFSIGPDAELTIDEFVFDPSTDAGSVVASITKGSFRFITGRVAIKDPRRMNVRLPQATIGVRGTMVAGEVRPAENVSEVVLLGPGPQNNTNEKIGAIVVSNAAGSVMIERPGFATSIAMLAPPTPPVALPPERVRALSAQSSVSTAARPPAPPPAASGGNGQGSNGQSASGQAGQGSQPQQQQQQGQQQPVQQQPVQQAGAPPPPVAPLPIQPPDAGLQLAATKDFFQSQSGTLAPPPQQQQTVQQIAQQSQPPLSQITTFDQLIQVTQQIVQIQQMNATLKISQEGINLAPTSGSGGGTFNFEARVFFNGVDTRTLNFSVSTTGLMIGAASVGPTPPTSPVSVYSETLVFGPPMGVTPPSVGAPDGPNLQTTLRSTNLGEAANFNPFFASGGRVTTINVEVANNLNTGRIFDQGKVTLTVTDGTNTITGTGTGTRTP